MLVHIRPEEILQRVRPFGLPNSGSIQGTLALTAGTLSTQVVLRWRYLSSEPSWIEFLIVLLGDWLRIAKGKLFSL